ncbi:MAG TPA: hypothetical protein VFC39_21400 [Acidobacteriaceae bacterium]|nr:hypothetical protein [Acidobacteriaceae bacterium]
MKIQRKPRTHLTYRYTLDTLLRAAYKKKYVEDATRDDVLDFITYWYEQELGARTVYDKVVTVLQLFKKHGRSGLVEKGDWPNYVDTIRPVYEPEELVTMFQAATDDEATLLKFVLGSGFRDQRDAQDDRVHGMCAFDQNRTNEEWDNKHNWSQVGNSRPQADRRSLVTFEFVSKW